MKAVDTNILVRLLARDDAAQARAADQIIAAGEVLIMPTVLLETEWVLRSVYRLQRREIAARLIAICGENGVIVVSEAAVLVALTAYAQAGDFADLLHFALASELGASSFATFDRAFERPEKGGPILEII